MALEQKKRSISFQGGLSDGTERFLLEPPALDYSENLRIDKKGSLQKRPGFGPSEVSTVPNATGSPLFIHGMGDDLHVLTDGGARTWDGTDWTEIDVPGFVGTSGVEVESQNQVGLGNCAYLPYLDGVGGNNGHAIAFEIRDQNSVSDPTDDSLKHVVFQRYDRDGKFVDQQRFDNARSPRLTAISDGVGVTLFFQNTANNELRFQATFPPLPSLPAPTETTTTVTSYPADAPALEHFAALDEGPRLGQGVYGQARYFVEYNDLQNRYYIAYQTVGGIYISARSVTGSIVDSATISRPTAGWGGNADILAMTIEGNFIFIAYQWWDRGDDVTGGGSGVGTGNWEVVVEQYLLSDLAGGPVFGQQVLESGNGQDLIPLYTHGSIGSIGSTSKVVLHYSGVNSGSAYADGQPGGTNYEKGRGNNWDAWNNRAQDVGLRVFEINWVSQSITHTINLPGHRLTTNLCRFEAQWYAGVQQWLDYTPHHINCGDSNRYHYVIPASKPVTTSICVFEDDKVPRPIAVLDAGQGGHVDVAEGEVALHLGMLVENHGDLLASNRVKLRAEDVSFYIGAASSFWKRASNVETSSDCLCRVHRIKKGLEGASVASFGDGLGVSTAVPMWFDGRFFAEFGPLDSPEIVRVEDKDHDIIGGDNKEYVHNASNQGYENLNSPGGSTNLAYRKFVAVMGYVDSRGNTHRSAPSATYYVGDLEEDRDIVEGPPKAWAGREVTVWVTMPISIMREELEYFVDIYTSTSEDDGLYLTAHETVDPADGGPATSMGLTIRLNRSVPDDTGKTKVISRSAVPLYTTGGVLAADPWPAFKHAVVTSTRFWAIDQSNKGRVIYSKLFEDFIAPEYNALLSINLGDERDLTAIGKLDDKVVVFEPNDIHVIYGEGPDNRGQGQDFAVHYISTDVGCSDQESVIETPAGLIFYSSPRGFYLLDRNLQIQFIGEGVEDIALGINVIAATMDPRKAEVRFLVEPDPDAVQTVRNGPDPDVTFRVPGQGWETFLPGRPVYGNELPDDACLSFNYEKGTWMLFTNYEGTAATIYQRQYTRLLSDWSVWQESETRFDDPTGTNRTLMRTPWIRLSEQVQDFNRLWRITFLGRYLSSQQDMGGEVYEAGDVRVRLYFDYERDWSQEKLFRIQDFRANQFNSSSLRAERFQFEMSPIRGRCQSVKIEIEEVDSDGTLDGVTYTLGHGFEIVSADFKIGVSPQRALLPKAVK